MLVAPTGAGKTLAGFLPSLIELSELTTKTGNLHTLYISPLKALATDIERNLMVPIREMALDISVETRTGDTPNHKRQRQKTRPPDILLTTPEQLALLLASREAKQLFQGLKRVIFDELHSLVISKRGQLLSLGLARLWHYQPSLQAIGLSATVADENGLRRWLVPQTKDKPMAELVKVAGGAAPEITILQSSQPVPWAGHSARYAMIDVYDYLKQVKTALIFVNTRSQAEKTFQELWHLNTENLAIALHHGSLDVGQRRRVEEAIATNRLRAVVATSTLDMGIDWGNLDLVIHIGAPKGASRLAQRIGRANHRMDEPSRALLVPANCFEILECQAALNANYIGAQDTPPIGKGAIDVLAQHLLGLAIAEPFDENEVFEEVTRAEPYSQLSFPMFKRIVDFVATGGYALKVYENFAKIRKNKIGRWRVSNQRIAQQYRLNIGTIVEAAELNVRLIRKPQKNLRRGRLLGRIEEGFVESLKAGDSFLFGGYILSFEGMSEDECYVTISQQSVARVPSYAGGRFPLSTYLAGEVRRMLAHPKTWDNLPPQVHHWLLQQQAKSVLPKQNELLIETFCERMKYYLVAYPFEGRLAHQTLGMLLTRRLERANMQPLGFVATDYAVGLWGLKDLDAAIESGQLSLAALFDEDMLGDDLEAWLDETYLLKRSFRDCATIAGLIQRRQLGKDKTGRQMTISSDLIFDVLRSHEPDHILLQATRYDAGRNLLDLERLATMLARIKHHIRHQHVDTISPLALPVMLEIGKEMVPGRGREQILEDAAHHLIAKALKEAEK